MSQELSKEDIDHLKRKMLFVPCETKKALHTWIKTYLHLDVPDTKVDPISTSTPMDAIWVIYEQARYGKDPDFSRILVYAARDTFKTLNAAILEVLCILHLNRDVVHLSSQISQSLKSQSYTKNFFNKPYLRDFVSGDNERKKLFLRYYHEGKKDSIPEREWKKLSPLEQNEYKAINNYIVIVAATLQSTNGQHTNFMCLDECDLISNPKVYAEAAMIPCPIGDQLPITLLTSTRKFSFGIVQDELNRAAQTGLKVLHWNVIDCCERCPEKRHLPEKPKIDVYYSEDTLETITPAEYAELGVDGKAHFMPDKAYEGCMKNCKLFAMCRGRLATEQKIANPIAKVRSMLKPVSHVQSLFRSVPIEVAKAQLLCWKPSSAGMIYSNLNAEKHMLSAAEIAYKITGEPQNPAMTKFELIQFLKEHKCRFVSGMDFGYTHQFATITAVVYGAECFVLDAFSVAELELGQQLELCESRLRIYDPHIAGDSAAPQNIATLKRNGYRIKPVKKGPDSVIAGIELTRLLIRPTIGQPRLFFLADDDGVQQAFLSLSSYHWKLDQSGKATNIPDDTDDDLCDAMRYLVMENFGKSGRVLAPRDTPTVTTPAATSASNFMRDIIDSHLGEASDTDEVSGPRKGKKGSFWWDMS